MPADCRELICSFEALSGHVPDILWRERVRIFYKHHNPAKEPEVPALLAQAPGQAEAIFRMLEQSYAVQYAPPPEQTAPPARSVSPTSPTSDGESPLRLCRAGGPRARGAYRRSSDASESSQSPISSQGSPVAELCPFPCSETTPAAGGLAARRQRMRERQRRSAGEVAHNEG
eukprot:TRINITY_DN1446_c3_g1_i1.p1 TRINITY_DN1446_c3_g1~~TRINITY_DN1446_c3_g1_i1.p1  ORF type:complete len:198 (+),score=37.89 TRINITY_DN1446_c3_g1_i1:78-596(+)